MSINVKFPMALFRTPATRNLGWSVGTSAPGSVRPRSGVASARKSLTAPAETMRRWDLPSGYDLYTYI